MNIEVLMQRLKSTLLRQAKVFLALSFAALALLLYLTSLLSIATALSDTFVDIAIYLIYLLLVVIITLITYISYHLFDEEPLMAVNSYMPESDALEIENLLENKEEERFTQEKQTERHENFSSIYTAARESICFDSSKMMEGFTLLEVSQVEKRAAYLKQQHPQIIAVILLMIDEQKAKTTLEAFTPSLRDEVLTLMQESEPVSKEAVNALDQALQEELSLFQKECSLLRDLESMEIREVLRHIDKRELMFALKSAKKELQETFFANMTSKASTEFKNILASVVQVDETKSQNALKNLYLLAQRLRENGKIRAGI